MERDVARKITDLATRRESLSESEVSHLLTLCRKYLDHLREEHRAQYPTLRFFCDWAVHISLDRSFEGFSVLKKLNDTLVQVAPVASKDTRLTEVLSFRRLRREMGELLERVGVPDSIVGDQQRWMAFVVCLIEIIRDCPVEVGDEDSMSRRAREVYEAIKANSLKPGAGS